MKLCLQPEYHQEAPRPVVFCSLTVHPQRRPCVLCLETESVTPNTHHLPKQAATTLSGRAQYSIMVHKSELREFRRDALSFSDPKLQEGKKISSSCYSLPAAKTLVLFLTEGLHCLFKGLAGDYSASLKCFPFYAQQGRPFCPQDSESPLEDGSQFCCSSVKICFSREL